MPELLTNQPINGSHVTGHMTFPSHDLNGKLHKKLSEKSEYLWEVHNLWQVMWPFVTWKGKIGEKAGLEIVVSDAIGTNRLKEENKKENE